MKKAINQKKSNVVWYVDRNIADSWDLRPIIAPWRPCRIVWKIKKKNLTKYINSICVCVRVWFRFFLFLLFWLGPFFISILLGLDIRLYTQCVQGIFWLKKKRRKQEDDYEKILIRNIFIADEIKWWLVDYNSLFGRVWLCICICRDCGCKDAGKRRAYVMFGHYKQSITNRQFIISGLFCVCFVINIVECFF